MNDDLMTTMVMNTLGDMKTNFDRLIPVVERAMFAHTVASLMTAAKVCDDLHDGRLREDFITLAQRTLAEAGVLGCGTAATDDGPRNIFQDGKLKTPDGTEWDLSS